MGEAKRRKQTDANYGRLPQFREKRGLVISPPVEINGSQLYAKSSNIDEMELRFALMYWDKLVWPQSRVIHFSSNPDEEFLEAEGVLQRPEYTFWGDGAQSIAQSQIQAFLDLDKSEPGAWALSQGENSLLLHDNHFERGGGGLVELFRAIPIPSHDVPLAEILEFKHRRKDELHFLRLHIDKLVSELEKSEHSESIIREQVATIDEACSDLLKLGKQWQFPAFVSNLKLSFTLSAQSVGPWAVGGWLLGQQFGLTAASLASAAGGAISSLELKGDIGLRSPQAPKNPFRYTYLAHEELR
ncbi:DUF6236 family protein [Marinobacter sp.]|uniref:DUF6236 family protein n=1 Tax=Marinobacter sp. TaxID=50741 RepID=UPI00384F1033